MNPYAYTNGAGYCGYLPDGPLEPRERKPVEDYEEEYDRAEDEMNGIFNRS